mgnify:CR=1 FL=1
MMRGDTFASPLFFTPASRHNLYTRLIILRDNPKGGRKSFLHKYINQ